MQRERRIIHGAQLPEGVDGSFLIAELRLPHPSFVMDENATSEDLVAHLHASARELGEAAKLVEQLAATDWRLSNATRSWLLQRAVAEDEDPYDVAATIAAADFPVSHWTRAADDPQLVHIGGLRPGHRDNRTFPGSPWPAVIQEQLTGRQTEVASHADARPVLSRAIREIADAVAERGGDLHDLQATGIPDELHDLAASIEHGRHPGYAELTVMLDSPFAALGGRGRDYSVAVWPISAVMFAGLSDSARALVPGSRILIARDGLLDAYRRAGAALAH